MNYTEILTTVRAYADRYNDTELDAVLDYMIGFAEARINRKLRIRDMSSRAYLTAVADQKYYGLPSDYMEMRSIKVIGDDITPRTMHFRNPEQMDVIDSGNASDYDRTYYNDTANQLRISPAVEAGLEIELNYYRKLPGLTATNTTNWMSDDYPDVYLAALMYEVEIFVKNDERALGFEARLDKALDELDITDAVSRWSGPALQIQSDVSA